MKLKDYLYYSENGIRLYNGNCLDVMRKLPDDYMDLIVTDPPYGYSFMGKNWDKVVIPVSHWKECLRVLKPGAFAFIMSAPRQDVLSRMIYNLQEAGFETGFSSIYWAYASGFPKASNIGKKIDKRLGRKRKVIKSKGSYVSTEKGMPINQAHNGKLKRREIFETEGTSALEGSYGGCQMKPAVEIIVIAMKSLSEKTYVDQALKNGKGITWLDNCRIPYKSEKDKEKSKVGHKEGIQKYGGTSLLPSKTKQQAGDAHINQKGRFPANLIVSNDVLNNGKISKSGQNCIRRQEGRFVEHKLGGKGQRQITHNDSGSYSRYFDLDSWWAERIKKLPPEVQKVFPYLIVPKASKSEKNKGCENLTDKTQDQDAKNRVWADKCGNCGLKFIGGEPRCHCPAEKKVTSKKNGYKYKNNHPTVKPIKLMSYLIILGSREGDIILDPFVGSGTTGISAKLLNRKFIGIEMSKEYSEIAKHRIKGN